MRKAHRDNAEAYHLWALCSDQPLDKVMENKAAILDGMLWFDTRTKELIDTPD